MIRLGCCSNNFNSWSFDDAVRLVHDLGFRVADISAGQFGGIAEIVKNPAAIAKRIRSVSAQSGVEFSEFMIFAVKPTETGTNALDSAIDCFRKLCSCAAEAGLKSILGSIDLPSQESFSEKQGLERQVELLGKSVAIASEFGISVNTEPGFNGPLVKDPANAVWLAQQVPGLGYTVDFAHFVAAGVPEEKGFALFPYTRHIHIKQSAPGMIKTMCHKGTVNYPAIIRELKRIDWDGVMVMECLSYSKSEQLDYDYYQEVCIDWKGLEPEGLVNHPAFQTVALAYEISRLLQSN